MRGLLPCLGFETSRLLDRIIFSNGQPLTIKFTFFFEIQLIITIILFRIWFRLSGNTFVAQFFLIEQRWQRQQSLILEGRVISKKWAVVAFWLFSKKGNYEPGRRILNRRRRGIFVHWYWSKQLQMKLLGSQGCYN